MKMEQYFINSVIGAVNTWIRAINDESMDSCGEPLISNRWNSGITQNKEFKAFLMVKGEERVIIFPKEDWYSHSSNMLGHKKLIGLHKELIKNVEVS